MNLPTRAVTGARWSGARCAGVTRRASTRPFTSTTTTSTTRLGYRFEFTVPDDLPSGAYLMRLAADGHMDELPFYVRPPRGRRGADVLFVASTYTYQAYANHARGNSDAAFASAWRRGAPIPHNPDDHPEFGRSTYNRHRDGSGICYSSRLRPVLSLRPRYLTFLDARGSGLRHFPADTHLTRLAGGEGYRLRRGHRRGRGCPGRRPARSDYPLMVTGSHPEYHTTPPTTPRGLPGRRRNLVYWAATDSTGASRPVRLARRDRDPPRGERHPRVGGPGRRVLQRARRRPTGAVAAQWAAAASLGRDGLLGAGALRGIRIGARRGPTTRARPGSRWGRRGRSSATSGCPAAGRPASSRSRGSRARHVGRRHRVARRKGTGRASSVVPEDLLSHLASATGERPSRIDARGHDVWPATGRRRHLRDGVHHLLRQPVAQPLRQHVSRILRKCDRGRISHAALDLNDEAFDPRARAGLGCRCVELDEVREARATDGAEIRGVDVKSLDAAGSTRSIARGSSTTCS